MNALRALESQVALLPASMILIPIGLFLIYVVVTRLVRRRGGHASAKTGILLLDVVAFPAFLVSLQLGVNDLAASRAPALRQTIWALLTLTAVWLIARLLKEFVWTRYFKRIHGSEAPRILQHLVSGTLFLAALAIIFAGVFRGSIGGVLVSTGVVVGVVGLSLQNVLGDLFSGITITIEKPYRVGDWISLPDGSLGEVTDITWQATYLTSFSNSRLVIPNSYALKSVVHNYSQPSKLYAEWINISVDRSYEPSIVRRLLLEATLTCEAVLEEPTPMVNVLDATGNPIRYMVYVNFKDYLSHFSGKNDLFMNIYSVLARAGISTSSAKYEVATESSGERSLRMPSLHDEVRSAEIFSMLSDDQIEQLTESATSDTYRPGEIIVSEGSEGSSLLIITSGVVLVTKHGERSQEVEMARLGAGDIFGEMSLLTGERRSATVKALVQVTAIQVTKEGLEPILNAEPALSDAFAQVMVERQLSQEQFIESMRRSKKPASEFVSEYVESFVRNMKRFFHL